MTRHGGDDAPCFLRRGGWGDEQFGELIWNDPDEAWVTSVTLPYFRHFGKNLTPDPDEPEGPGADVDHEAGSQQEPTLEQLKAQAELQSQLASYPAEQRAMMEAILAAAQRGIDRNELAPPQASEEDEDPLDPEKLFHQERFLLEIETGGRRKPPSQAQRQAWEKLVERGDALWDELLAILLDEYQLQQPVRARWWRAVYGERQIQRALPEVKCVEELRALLRPSLLRIPQTSKKSEPAEIEVHLACAWHRDALEVVVRNGKPPVLLPGSVMPWERSAKQRLQHPELGTLSRQREDGPWTGSVACEPFRDYQALIADQRASFRENPAEHGPPTSLLRWDFVHGMFDLRVHAGPGEEPAVEQAKALVAFKEDEARNVAAIIQAVFEHYRAVYEDARSEYMDRHLKEKVPEPTSPDLLHERLQLLEVNVFPADEAGKVDLGFVLLCSWDPGADLGVRWRNGQVEAVGVREVGRP